MPCVYDDTAEVNAKTTTELRKLASLRKEQLDRVTDMLCRVLTFMESAPNMSRMPLVGDLLLLHPDLPVWWQHHKEADIRRQAIEVAESELKRVEDKLRKLREEE